MGAIVVGIDIGSTYTDGVFFHLGGVIKVKVNTTPHDLNPWIGQRFLEIRVMAGVVANDLGLAGQEAVDFWPLSPVSP